MIPKLIRRKYAHHGLYRRDVVDFIFWGLIIGGLFMWPLFIFVPFVWVLGFVWIDAVWPMGGGIQDGWGKYADMEQ